MGRVLKILAVAVAVTALALVFTFGFAIWVFIPLLPAAVVYLIALYALRRTPALRAKESENQRDKAA